MACYDLMLKLRWPRSLIRSHASEQAIVGPFPRLIRSQPTLRLIHDEDGMRRRSIQALIKLSLLSNMYTVSLW